MHRVSSLTTMLLFIGALLFPLSVFEIRVEPFQCVYDVCRSDASRELLIPLSIINVPAKPSKFGRSWVEGQQGIYIKNTVSPLLGIFVGVATPILLIAWGVFRILKRRPSI